MVLSQLSVRFIIPWRYQSLVLMRRIRWNPLPQLQCFRNFFHARNGPWIETDGNLKVQDQGCILGVVAVRFLPILEFLSWLFMQYGVCCKRTLFWLTDAVYLCLKIFGSRRTVFFHTDVFCMCSYFHNAMFLFQVQDGLMGQLRDGVVFQRIQVRYSSYGLF